MNCSCHSLIPSLVKAQVRTILKTYIKGRFHPLEPQPPSPSYTTITTHLTGCLYTHPISIIPWLVAIFTFSCTFVYHYIMFL